MCVSHCLRSKRQLSFRDVFVDRTDWLVVGIWFQGRGSLEHFLQGFLHIYIHAHTLNKVYFHGREGMPALLIIGRLCLCRPPIPAQRPGPVILCIILCRAWYGTACSVTPHPRLHTLRCVCCSPRSQLPTIFAKMESINPSEKLDQGKRITPA